MNSKKIDIRDKIGILIASALLILVILGASSFSYLKIKKRIISDIDRSLLVGAASIKNLLPEDFHDKATSLKSVAPEDDRQNIMALSEYANRINFKFLYTLIKNDKKIYITSSSATEEELAQNEQVRYFTLFEEADPHFHSAFDSNTSISFTHKDRWGIFRVLALPEKSPEGKKYLSVAEFDISYLNRIFQSVLIETIIIALLLLLGALPLYFVVSKRLRRIVNELQVVQIELKKSEERFSLAMEASKEGIWDWDLQTGTIYCSPALISMLGYNTTKVIQNVDEWQELIHPEDKQKAYQANFDCVNNLTDSFEIEYRMKTKDEGLKWVLGRGKVVYRDASGRALRLVGTHQDITERKQADEEHQLLFQLIDNADSIAVSKDLDLRYLNVNQAYLKLTGHKSVGDILGKTDAELFQGIATDEQIREYMDNDLKALRLPAGESITIEERLAGDDGGERFFLTKKFPIYSKDSGDLLCVSTLSTEITERKRAEETLRESERRFQKMLEVVPDMISIHSPEMEILYSNWQGFGAVPEGNRLTNTKCHKTYRGFDEICPDCRAREVLQSGDPIYEETRLPDGTWVDLRIIPLIGKDNKVEMFMEWLRDITVNKTVEEERERLGTQLQQAQKMEAIGRLAGGVAHDFNNMLGVILGHAEMILQEITQASPFYDNLMEIQKAGARSADLTRQLLAFARKQTVAPKVIDLNKTVGGMLKMLQRLIGEDIDMAWIPGENIWPVKIDPVQIDQILANLCVNARDAITGIGKITIETKNAIFDESYCADHAEFAPGEYTMLAVSDNGCGMNTETMKNIFEPFFTTKKCNQGTGLGLATVYGIVKQNDGFINVYSEPKHGTTFKIYFPRYRTKADLLPEKEEKHSTERGHETILLVEDEPSILRMTTMMLERMGFSVVPASTPGEAIRIAHEHVGKIHLLVTDVVMPEMNGRDLAKNILSSYPNLKRLFMSGYTANVIAHHGVLDDGVNFIQKPFSMEQLGAKVREVLDKAKGSSQA